MAGAATAYEEQRRRIVEENQRKVQELGLLHLSAAVRDAAPKPSPVRSTLPLISSRRFHFVWIFFCFPLTDSRGASQAKSVKRKRAPRDAGEDAPVRRSGRVASLPDKPKYRYEVVYLRDPANNVFRSFSPSTRLLTEGRLFRAGRLRRSREEDQEVNVPPDSSSPPRHCI
jgi:hypothetical protein